MEKRGVSAIIYDNNGTYYFLILHRTLNWDGWEFCKGGINDGESPDQAVAREISEETGLSKFEIKKKLEVQRTFEKDGVQHIFDIFLVEASMNIPVVIDKNEHDTYLWTTQDRVMEKLTWPEEKEAFKEAFAAIKDLN